MLNSTLDAINQNEFNLVELTDGIQISWAKDKEKISFVHSFSRAGIFRRISAANQSLLKACSNRRHSIHTILDLTGGWGLDSFTLAYHGKAVTLLERNELVFAIVSASLTKALAEQHTKGAAERIKPLKVNSLTYLAKLTDNRGFDCVYLDPMFPAHKSTARPGKEMQLLQKITNNQDIGNCFDLALRLATNRVVVKRPAKTSTLTSLQPDLVYREKTIRFDVYLTSRSA